MKRFGLVFGVLLLSGCGIRLGHINSPPAPSGYVQPTRVTVSRISSFTGWPAPMVFTIDGEEIYGLWGGQSYSFMLDPGDYIFGYYLAFNECRHFVRIKQRPTQHIRIGPPCKIEGG